MRPMLDSRVQPNEQNSHFLVPCFHDEREIAIFWFYVSASLILKIATKYCSYEIINLIIIYDNKLLSFIYFPEDA